MVELLLRAFTRIFTHIYLIIHTHTHMLLVWFFICLLCTFNICAGVRQTVWAPAINFSYVFCFILANCALNVKLLLVFNLFVCLFLFFIVRPIAHLLWRTYRYNWLISTEVRKYTHTRLLRESVLAIRAKHPQDIESLKT